MNPQESNKLGTKLGKSFVLGMIAGVKQYARERERQEIEEERLNVVQYPERRGRIVKLPKKCSVYRKKPK